MIMHRSDTDTIKSYVLPFQTVIQVCIIESLFMLRNISKPTLEGLNAQGSDVDITLI